MRQALKKADRGDHEMSKIAIVTGGTRGIGRAISERLVKDGYKVASTYAGNDEAAQACAQEIGVSVYKFDVADFDACAEGIQKIEAELGACDVLVNNAGITWDAPFHKMTKEAWTKVIDVDLNSAFNMTRNVWDGMRDRGFGRVINISSINGQKGQLGQTNYAASKAGMHGFTMALAQEVARKGVTVNTVSPGYIATEMVMAVSEDIRNAIIAGIPVNRLGNPEEVAALVDFIASEEAAFATGADFSMNGGQHMM